MNLFGHDASSGYIPLFFLLAIQSIFSFLCIGAFSPSKLHASEELAKYHIFVPTGHSGSGVDCAALSPDEQWLATGAFDNLIIIWEMESGKEFRKLKGHHNSLAAIDYSPDGSKLISVSSDGELISWNSITGEILSRKHFEWTGEFFYPKLYWPHKNSIAIQVDKKTTLLDSTSLLQHQGSEQITGDILHTDEQGIFTKRNIDSQKWLVNLHSPINGAILHSQKIVGEPVGFDPESKGVISLEAGLLVTGFWTGETSKKTPVKVDGTMPYDFPVFFSKGKYYYANNYPNADIGSVQPVVYCLDDGEQGLKWSFRTKLDFALSHLNFFIHSPLHQCLLIHDNDSVIKLDSQTGEILPGFSTPKPDISSMDTIPESEDLIYADDSSIYQWHVQKADRFKLFDHQQGYIRWLKVSHDGKELASGGDKEYLEFFDLVKKNKLLAVPEPDDEITLPRKIFKGIYSFDDKSLLIFDHWLSSQSYTFWDCSAKLFNRLNGSYKCLKEYDGEPPLKARFSSDGSRIEILFQLKDSPALHLLKYETSGIRQLSDIDFIPPAGESYKYSTYILNSNSAFLNESNRIALALNKADGEYIALFDSESGDFIRAWKAHDAEITALNVSKDEKWLFSGGMDNLIKIWDIAGGRLSAVLAGHDNSIMQIIHDSRNQRLYSLGSDGAIIIWSIPPKSEIARCYSFSEDDWLIMTPEGYYASAALSHNKVNVRHNDRLYVIDQFYDVFYRPDLVEAKLKGEDISRLITLTIDEALRNPPPTVQIGDFPKTVNKMIVTVKYKVESKGGGIGEVRVFHNGKLVKSDGFYRTANISQLKPQERLAMNGRAIHDEYRNEIKKGKQSSTETKDKGQTHGGSVVIEPVPGKNTISVAAFNAHNTVQSRLKTISFSADIPEAEPHLYVLAVGLGSYADPSIPMLYYAVKDAHDMAATIRQQAKSLFKPENIHVKVLQDEIADRNGILTAINEISKQAKVGDSLILFNAGHGFLIGSQYFIAPYDSDLTRCQSTLISSNTIIEMSKKIKALDQLLIFDTCHAGGVDYIVSGLYDARMSVIARKMGLHIYAAASPHEGAMDGYKGNGLFTHVILEGLKNNSSIDSNQDNNVSVAELGKFSRRKTLELSRKAGLHQEPLIINFGQDYPVYKLAD